MNLLEQVPSHKEGDWGTLRQTLMITLENRFFLITGNGPKSINHPIAFLKNPKAIEMMAEPMRTLGPVIGGLEFGAQDTYNKPDIPTSA